LSLEKKRDITSNEIYFVESNLFSKPKQCAKILDSINPNVLTPIDAAFYYKQRGLEALNNGDYFKAYQNIQQSIQIAKADNYQHLVDAGNINLSAVYYNTQQYKKAIHHAFIASRSKNKKFQALAYQNLGTYYELSHDYKKAMVYNNKSIALAEELGSSDTCIAGLINSGNIMIQLKKQNKAKEYFESALKIVLEKKLKLYYADVYIYLADYYSHYKDHKNAIKNAKSSLKYALEFNVLRNFPNIYTILIRSYFEQNKIEKAKHYLDEFFNIENIGDDEIGLGRIYDLQIEIEYKTAGAEAALKAAKDKIEFLEHKTERAKNKTEFYRQFKEEENEKIEESRLKLAHSNKELVNIAKILAHDIKTPVRTLGSFSELLKKQLEKENNPVAIEYLDFITKASVNLYSKLESALSLILMEINKPLVLVDLNNSIEKMKLKFKELNISSPKQLPNIKSNKRLIDNLLYCIFENATIYNSKANPSVKITCQIIDNQHIFHFEDNGDGISMEELNKVFNIFYTSLPNKRKGMGLSICKKICELHNGSIIIESKLNEGTTVIIKLPKS